MSLYQQENNTIIQVLEETSVSSRVNILLPNGKTFAEDVSFPVVFSRDYLDYKLIPIQDLTEFRPNPIRRRECIAEAVSRAVSGGILYVESEVLKGLTQQAIKRLRPQESFDVQIWHQGGIE